MARRVKKSASRSRRSSFRGRVSRRTANRRSSPVRRTRVTARRRTGAKRSAQRITLVIRHEAPSGNSGSSGVGLSGQSLAVKRATL